MLLACHQCLLDFLAARWDGQAKTVPPSVAWADTRVRGSRHMPPCLGDDGPRVQSYEYRLSDDMDMYGERFEVQHQSVEGYLRSYVQVH